MKSGTTNGGGSLRPARESAYPIPRSEWNRIVERIESLRDRSPLLSNIVSASAGVCATALVAALNLSDEASTVLRVLYWTGFATSLFTGSTALVYAKLHREDRADVRTALVDDLQAMAARYDNPDPQQ